MKLITVKQAAERLNVSISKAYRMVDDGDLKAFRLGPKGSSIRIIPESVDRYIREQIRIFQLENGILGNSGE